MTVAVITSVASAPTSNSSTSHSPVMLLYSAGKEEEINVNPFGKRSKITDPSEVRGPRFFTLIVKLTIDPTRATDLSAVFVNCKSLFTVPGLSNVFIWADKGWRPNKKKNKPMMVSGLNVIFLNFNFLFTGLIINFNNTF